MLKSSGKNEIAIDRASRLIELAKKELDYITESETELFHAVVRGEIADYSDDAEKNNKPVKARDWNDKRVLRAKIIAWLSTNPQVLALISHRGIMIKGARIDGELELRYAKISFPLYFEKSTFPRRIDLRDAKIRALHCHETHIGQIRADNLEVEGDVFLNDGFKAKGEICLLHARISGNFGCNNGHFINKSEEGRALIADGMQVKGNVFLDDGFKAEGEVRLLGARISGNLECSNGHFINKNKEGGALIADRMQVEGGVFLHNGFKAEGVVRLLGARISGNLECTNGHFINPNGYAIIADGMQVKGYVFMNDNFKAEGVVRLSGARISGNLSCSSGHFINPKSFAFIANGMQVEGYVFMNDGFKAEGEISLLDARISFDFDCKNGHFTNENKKAEALIADGTRIDGCIYLNDGFKAKGEVGLTNARIGGSLECSNGQFINPDRNALLEMVS